MKTKRFFIILSLLVAAIFATFAGGSTEVTTTSSTTKTTTTTTNGIMNADDEFSSRDMEQTADLSDATYLTLESGEDITITAAGVYVISGSAKESTIIVEAGDEDKVQLVLDGVTITNTSTPCIYVKNADKVFVTTTDSTNKLTVSGTFAADGDTNTDLRQK